MPKVDKDSPEFVKDQREANAKPRFFLRSATWLLARFPLTKNRYQNWTTSRRILVGWLLWIICLPIIPLVAILIWYFNDPEGFKKSPWAKALIALFIAWAAAFGFIATNTPQIDANGKYSPIQTQADGEKADAKASIEKPDSVPSEDAKKAVEGKTTSNDSEGKTFANCTEAFEAGVFDIKRSSSAYQSKLDRDNDGIACER